MACFSTYRIAHLKHRYTWAALVEVNFFLPKDFFISSPGRSFKAQLRKKMFLQTGAGFGNCCQIFLFVPLCRMYGTGWYLETGGEGRVNGRTGVRVEFFFRRSVPHQ